MKIPTLALFATLLLSSVASATHVDVTIDKQKLLVSSEQALRLSQVLEPLLSQNINTRSPIDWQSARLYAASNSLNRTKIRQTALTSAQGKPALLNLISTQAIHQWIDLEINYFSAISSLQANPKLPGVYSLSIPRVSNHVWLIDNGNITPIKWAERLDATHFMATHLAHAPTSASWLYEIRANGNVIKHGAKRWNNQHRDIQPGSYLWAPDPALDDDDIFAITQEIRHWSYHHNE